jgi:hypothetical protein
MGSTQAFLLSLFGLVGVSSLTDVSGTAQPAPVPPIRTVLIGTALQQSNVPPSWKQGVFLHPQSISAVDISADGRWVGITTMAFRHDRNFWLLGEEGKVQWGRYVQPWAPFQAALLSPPRSPGQENGVRGAFGVGLAYSRFTDPSPTVALFQGEKSTETALVDNLWDMGWLRYGHGDWRTGWPASLIGDLIVRTRSSLLTVLSHDGADSRRQKHSLLEERPFRLMASGDGQVLAFGYLVPDLGRLDENTRQRLRRPPALLTVRHALTSERLWTVAPMQDAKPVMQPPCAHLAPAACSQGREGTAAAATEHGGRQHSDLPRQSYPFSRHDRRTTILRVGTGGACHSQDRRCPRRDRAPLQNALLVHLRGPPRFDRAARNCQHTAATERKGAVAPDR